MKRSIYFLMRPQPNFVRTIKSKSADITECYRTLNLPIHSNQDAVRKAFLELAKKYHPDSGSLEADIDKFVTIENAFRTLTKHNTGCSNKEEVEQIVYNIKHTAPQHRQYLSYEGYGHGTPFQRQKQYAKSRAEKAAINVMEHRIEKAVASEKTLMKKGQYGKKHDIKTKYGFDRLVEDLIQESISKGDFENLKGTGKPLRNQNSNPYVDFTTHKLNEVLLINNGFTPEWITMSKEIDEDVEQIKKDISEDRMYLGPYPLQGNDMIKWENICQRNNELAKSINTKINTFNLIVPLLNKQKFHIDIEMICDDILKNGAHSVVRKCGDKVPVDLAKHDTSEDLLEFLYKTLGEIFTFKKEKKKS